MVGTCYLGGVACDVQHRTAWRVWSGSGRGGRLQSGPSPPVCPSSKGRGEQALGSRSWSTGVQIHPGPLAVEVQVVCA